MVTINDRKPRLGLHLPLDVSGRETSGAPFAEKARSLNVSGGGICFESAKDIPFGSRLTIHIQLPPPLRSRFGGRTIYRVSAVVCRVEKISGHPASKVGARFVGEVEA